MSVSSVLVSPASLKTPGSLFLLLPPGGKNYRQARLLRISVGVICDAISPQRDSLKRSQSFAQTRTRGGHLVDEEAQRGEEGPGLKSWWIHHGAPFCIS